MRADRRKKEEVKLARRRNTGDVEQKVESEREGGREESRSSPGGELGGESKMVLVRVELAFILEF